MKKKLLAIFICVVMVAGLLPTVAFAAENYNLYVDGERLISFIVRFLRKRSSQEKNKAQNRKLSLYLCCVQIRIHSAASAVVMKAPTRV